MLVGEEIICFYCGIEVCVYVVCVDEIVVFMKMVWC